jgi:hypothetical protein
MNAALQRRRQGDGDDLAGRDRMTPAPHDAVAEGRSAWQRLCERERKSWSDWLLVGHASIAGRAEAMQQVKANRPLGSKYNRLFGEWLRENGFDSISNQARYRLVLVLEHPPEIEAWRESLDDVQRGRLNHPSAVWFAWKRATKAEAATPHRQHVVLRAAPKPKKTGNGRPIHWNGDAIKRAAIAIREAYSTDFYVLLTGHWKPRSETRLI